MNLITQTKKPTLVRLSEEMSDQLAEIKRRIGVPKEHVIRTGIQLAIEKIYEPLLAQAETTR